nr:RNA polymerase sigma factor [Paenibacillus caui]
MIQAHVQALSGYCRFLTGSDWEGEDLLQETWLKVWSASKDKKGPLQINRSYLRRIAYHAWIDRCRKKNAEASPEDVYKLEQPAASDLFSLWSAFEKIVKDLTVNQRGALLLMDVYRYTAVEAAALLKMTEGAVKASLHRARQKLKEYHKPDRTAVEDADFQTGTGVDESTVYAYLEAFKHHNILALVMLLNEGSSRDVVPVLQNQSRAVRCSRDDSSKAANGRYIRSILSMAA